VPRFILQYRGEQTQYVVGAAFGPGGLYFTALLPNAEGESPVYKLSYDPAHAHPFNIYDDQSTLALMIDKGCFACHTRDGTGGTAGPVLDADVMIPNIETRLASEQYAQRIEELAETTEEPFRSFRAARQEVFTATGEEQLRLWLQYHLLEPRFDNPGAQMPNLGLTEDEAERITAFLLQAQDSLPEDHEVMPSEQ
jgi:hypothetical protein